MSSIRFERVAFAWNHATILKPTSLELPSGWTGLVGKNGSGKTTLLRLLTGELEPNAGRIQFSPASPRVSLCPQDIEMLTSEIETFAALDDGIGHRLRGALHLEERPVARWSTLSPGERKRWQLGAALSQEPDILLLDEPTNHADSELRALLLSALRRFRGVGLVVSHDRALLAALTHRTLRLHQREAHVFTGSYEMARSQWEAAASAALERRVAAQDDARKATRALTEARRTLDAAQREMSGRHLKRDDHDARSMGAQNRKAWAEARLGKDVHRRRHAAERTAEQVERFPIDVPLGGTVFLGFEPAPRPVVLSLDADEVRAGSTLVARDVHVQVGRAARIRLQGGNGAGKSTLLQAMVTKSESEKQRLLYLPQELSDEEANGLRDQVAKLDPIERGRVLSLVAALGSDPARLLASPTPSPGELRKLQLALGLGRQVWALILDEPTNHLDLPTVERLERALGRYPGAILLVTHDDAFASACTTESWHIGEGRLEHHVTEC